jgi:Rad3-related DNA helicase
MTTNVASIPTRLSNKVAFFALKKNSQGERLKCSSTVFDSEEYSFLIKEIASMIPGTCLVFCPTYKIQKELFKKLGRFRESLFVSKEPESRDALKDVVKSIMGKKSSSVLLAVFRGKLSDGFNFPEGAVRGVLCIGVPYGSLNEPNVLLQVCAGQYTADAMKAVNQASGRLHRGRLNDFGVVVYLDARYSESECRDHLKISSGLKVMGEFAQLKFGISEFFSS